MLTEANDTPQRDAARSLFADIRADLATIKFDLTIIKWKIGITLVGVIILVVKAYLV